MYKIIKLSLVVLISAFICTDVFAQTSVVTGTIRDKNTKETLPGATIVEKGNPTNGRATDFNGKFEIRVDLNTPKTLIVSYIGYETIEVVVTKAKTYIDIDITPSGVLAKEVEVVSTRQLQRILESPVTVERLNAAAIKETPAIGFYEGLANLKGVDMTSASLGFKVINTRGFNSTSPVRTLQIIDGVDNQAPGLNFALGNFVGASELDVEGVDLIVGANSAIYGPNAFNGVISITTKDPFKYRGFSAQLKQGTRDLFDGAFRYAGVIKDRIGVKFNVSYLKANDYEARNFAAADNSFNQPNAGIGYNGVNIYGDEVTGSPYTRATFPDSPDSIIFVYRSGYRERDLTDYDTYSLKLSGGVFIKPFRESDAMVSYSYNRGTGSTVYQGDNRYAVKNIVFQQHRVQAQGNRWLIRGYQTLEDAGDSYDVVFTAFKLNQLARSNRNWFIEFERGYRQVRDNNSMSFDQKMVFARARADNNNLKPGTPEFDAALKKITSNASFLPTGPGDVGGTRFQDFSNLSHLDAQYNFDLTKLASFLPETFIVGTSYRLYRPQSFGTIFSDTLNDRNDINSGFTKISVFEYGFFASAEKRILDEKVKLIGSLRRDEHQNFKGNFSPAASILYTYKPGNVFRLTYTTAIRNPTLQDQYLFYDIGRATLRGNLTGFTGILLEDYLNEFLLGNPPRLIEYKVDPVRPEKVRTFEFGLKGTFFRNLFFDASYYYSTYEDFLGYVILVNNPNEERIFRVAANATTKVSSQGFSAGANYYLNKFITLNGNYTYAVLNKPSEEDPLIPSFNTPKNKFNVGINGRDIGKFGFNLTYKWVEGFEFTGSPQFSGFIPSYGLLDGQINFKINDFRKTNQLATIKLGVSNMLNNVHFEAYGAPEIGILGYFSATIEF